MREFFKSVRATTLLLLALILAPSCALAQSDPCPRPAQGSVIVNPPDLYSQNGVLKVTLNYYTTVDQWGRTLFCYVDPQGDEGPTLHLNPGDLLDLTLTNLESGGPPPAFEQVAGKSTVCGAFYMTAQSANLHFHGLNVSPKCHGDEVIHTIVNPGESFHYKIRIPKDEPPGMYWYHAHIHGIASPAVQGGASGAIEIEGIANFQPAVQGLPQRFLVFRDQPLQNPPKNQKTQPTAPFWDVSMNYVPIPYPNYTPGVIQMQAGAQEFWRVVNASADTIMDVQLLYDGQAQPLQLVALDGVPIGSQDGRHQGIIITQTDVYIPPASRAEFIVTGPSSSVQHAVLMTNHIDTGPAGDVDTRRPLALIQLTKDARRIPKPIMPIAAKVDGERFAGLDDSMVTARRRIYFDEKIKTAYSGGKLKTAVREPGGGALFYVTVQGQNDTLYYPDMPPAITTTQGAVEDWTIENHSQEVHEFHIHQIHFQLIAINGVRVSPEQRQWYDTYQVPYYSGTGKYPSITVRMDFRGAVPGEFVYHCHILDHEDGGMMANILVLPRGGNAKHARAQDHQPAEAKAIKVGSRAAPQRGVLRHA
jgi:FtsP/CotA-like multicopper oxidase with cupredoxin domain